MVQDWLIGADMSMLGEPSPTFTAAILFKIAYYVIQKPSQNKGDISKTTEPRHCMLILTCALRQFAKSKNSIRKLKQTNKLKTLFQDMTCHVELSSMLRGLQGASAVFIFPSWTETL